MASQMKCKQYFYGLITLYSLLKLHFRSEWLQKIGQNFDDSY